TPGMACARHRASSHSAASRERGARRSADPDSHIASPGREPAPAAVIAVIGIDAKSAKAAAEMGDMMEAADPTDVSNAVEAAESVADAVDAAAMGAMPGRHVLRRGRRHDLRREASRRVAREPWQRSPS